jgi:hypothetical protein
MIPENFLHPLVVRVLGHTADVAGMGNRLAFRRMFEVVLDFGSEFLD